MVADSGGLAGGAMSLSSDCTLRFIAGYGLHLTDTKGDRSLGRLVLTHQFLAKTN